MGSVCDDARHLHSLSLPIVCRAPTHGPFCSCAEPLACDRVSGGISGRGAVIDPVPTMRWAHPRVDTYWRAVTAILAPRPMSEERGFDRTPDCRMEEERANVEFRHVPRPKHLGIELLVDVDIAGFGLGRFGAERALVSN